MKARHSCRFGMFDDRYVSLPDRERIGGLLFLFEQAHVFCFLLTSTSPSAAGHVKDRLTYVDHILLLLAGLPLFGECGNYLGEGPCPCSSCLPCE